MQFKLKRDAIDKITSENDYFGLLSNPQEVAQQYWVQYMNPSERLEIMNHVGDFKTIAKKLSACLKIIENEIRGTKK